MLIQMHLGDFDTSQEEIKVYCNKHIPENTDSGVLWKITEDDDKKEIGKKVFVEALTVNAKDCCDENYPNVYNCVMVKKFGENA
jgi:hypothetical protein